jgi:hypothetical protein
MVCDTQYMRVANKKYKEIVLFFILHMIFEWMENLTSTYNNAVIITPEYMVFFIKQQPCNLDTVKSRQSYCRIQFENIGSPFYWKSSVKHTIFSRREMSGLSRNQWNIDFRGISPYMGRRNGTVSIQRNFLCACDGSPKHVLKTLVSGAFL